MVQVDVPVAFALGQIFADAAKKQLLTGKPEYYLSALLKNNIYQIFFFSWIPVYFLANYFGWESTHMWWHKDNVLAYPFFLPLFILVFFFAANSGFCLSALLIRKGRLLLVRASYVGIFVYSLVWIFGLWHRTSYLGTHNEWAHGTAKRVWDTSGGETFIYMLFFTLIVWFVALILFIKNLISEGKHLDT
ncbi:MAG TPA: hypothetical protein ACFYEM_03740 [Candidatus Hypogeohydataceae bacterium YC40]